MGAGAGTADRDTAAVNERDLRAVLEWIERLTMIPDRFAAALHRSTSRCRFAPGRIGAAAVALLLAGALSAAAPADEELPGRVGRIADFAGHLYLSPQDRPSE